MDSLMSTDEVVNIGGHSVVKQGLFFLGVGLLIGRITAPSA